MFACTARIGSEILQCSGGKSCGAGMADTDRRSSEEASAWQGDAHADVRIGIAEGSGHWQLQWLCLR